MAEDLGYEPEAAGAINKPERAETETSVDAQEAIEHDYASDAATVKAIEDEAERNLARNDLTYKLSEAIAAINDTMEFVPEGQGDVYRKRVEALQLLLEELSAGHS
jgi:hypothetical protein